MRLLLFMITVVTTATVLNTPTKAQNYPWCAQYSDGQGQSCGFATFQECLADVSGIGGFCTQNSTYQPSAGPRASRFRRGYPY